MFDCAGYVFGSGLVFHSGKKGGEEKGAAFVALNPASGGEESLTAGHLKAGQGPLPALSPLCTSTTPWEKETGPMAMACAVRP